MTYFTYSHLLVAACLLPCAQGCGSCINEREPVSALAVKAHFKIGVTGSNHSDCNLTLLYPMSGLVLTAMTDEAYRYWKIDYEAPAEYAGEHIRFTFFDTDSGAEINPFQYKGTAAECGPTVSNPVSGGPYLASSIDLKPLASGGTCNYSDYVIGTAPGCKVKIKIKTL